MKYNLYSEVPDNEKKPMSGALIKEIANSRGDEVNVIKNNLCDHEVFFPYEEIDDDKTYYVYSDAYIAGSGIAYGKMFIFEDFPESAETISKAGKSLNNEILSKETEKDNSQSLSELYNNYLKTCKEVYSQRDLIADTLIKYANEHFVGRTYKQDKKEQYYTIKAIKSASYGFRHFHICCECELICRNNYHNIRPDAIRYPIYDTLHKYETEHVDSIEFSLSIDTDGSVTINNYVDVTDTDAFKAILKHMSNIKDSADRIIKINDKVKFLGDKEETCGIIEDYDLYGGLFKILINVNPMRYTYLPGNKLTVYTC